MRLELGLPCWPDDELLSIELEVGEDIVVVVEAADALLIDTVIEAAATADGGSGILIMIDRRAPPRANCPWYFYYRGVYFLDVADLSLITIVLNCHVHPRMNLEMQSTYKFILASHAFVIFLSLESVNVVPRQVWINSQNRTQ